MYRMFKAVSYLWHILHAPLLHLHARIRSKVLIALRSSLFAVRSALGTRPRPAAPVSASTQMRDENTYFICMSVHIE